jgi:hypothetical protein
VQIFEQPACALVRVPGPPSQITRHQPSETSLMLVFPSRTTLPLFWCQPEFFYTADGVPPRALTSPSPSHPTPTLPPPYPYPTPTLPPPYPHPTPTLPLPYPHPTPSHSLKTKPVVDKLVSYLVVPPPPNADARREFKYPYLACEIFCCEVRISQSPHSAFLIAHTKLTLSAFIVSVGRRVRDAVRKRLRVVWAVDAVHR